MIRPRPPGWILASVLGGGGGGAAAAFAPNELAQLAAREASNPELLQFSGGDGFLIFIGVLVGLVFIGMGIMYNAGWDGYVSVPD